MYTAIMAWTNSHRVTKYADFKTAEKAAQHIVEHHETYPDAFVIEKPSDRIAHWLIDPKLQTVSISVPAQPVDALKKRAAKRRWQIETGGIYFDGLIVPTDDRSKVLLQARALTLQDDDVATFISGNERRALTGKQFREIYTRVIDHVQQCFETHSVILDAIEADGVTTFEEIDGWMWPGSVAHGTPHQAENQLPTQD